MSGSDFGTKGIPEPSPPPPPPERSESTPVFTCGNFTVVDMHQGFLQYAIAEGSLPIAAFWDLETAKTCAELLAARQDAAKEGAS